MRIRNIVLCMSLGLLAFLIFSLPPVFAIKEIDKKEIDSLSQQDFDLIETARQLDRLPVELQTECLRCLLSPVKSFMSHYMVNHYAWSETLRFPHTVLCTAFSPDGTKLASGLDDGSIGIQDMVTHQSLTLSGNTDPVIFITFSPDGKTLAAGLRDGTIKLWDIHAGKLIDTLEGHFNRVNTVAFSPDGKTLASGSDDRTMKIWDLETGEVRSFTYTRQVCSVAFSPDGSKVVTGTDNGEIRIQRVPDGAIIKELKQGRYVASISFSRDGRKLATTYTLDWERIIWFITWTQYNVINGINIWDTNTWELITTLEGHTRQTDSAVFSPDGKLLASGSVDGTMKIWDLDKRKLILSFNDHKGFVWGVDFSPDGSKVASASEDKTVKIWHLYDEAALKILFAERYSPSVVILFYVLHQNWSKGVNLTETEKALEAKYQKRYPGEKLPSLLKFRQTYGNLPVELKRWVLSCFNVVL